ncbi:Hypothetical protein CINCED_3A004697 [Cinara cedri]|uniref:XRN2-binding (XTBD) domain-containing protein n=1 Tax=Cinara cedri TaxID=506608 RepID=A0A5E4N7G5_9HEMI|nr:Hypothetical protein CINCED_3A004697 [Cinara cedri]
MSFDTTWDVDQYKSEHENEEHWLFRRRFLIAHKDKFPEDRLVSLAQVFFNIEFLGCKYPKKTMDLVESLALQRPPKLKLNAEIMNVSHQPHGYFSATKIIFVP